MTSLIIVALFEDLLIYYGIVDRISEHKFDYRHTLAGLYFLIIFWTSLIAFKYQVFYFKYF